MSGTPDPEIDYSALRESMVEHQIAARGVRDPRVLAAMRAVPRHRFVPPNMAASAYRDAPLSIGMGQTISQPYIVALMLEMPGVAPDAVDQAPGETHPVEVLTEKDMRELQKANIIRALNQANWKVSGKGGAAELLGIRPTTLYSRLQKLGLTSNDW